MFPFWATNFVPEFRSTKKNGSLAGPDTASLFDRIETSGDSSLAGTHVTGAGVGARIALEEGWKVGDWLVDGNSVGFNDGEEVGIAVGF
jgi:hypothetical protein